MLLQFLLSISLSTLIALGAAQSLLLLTKVHVAQVALSQEQAEIRLLVGYSRHVLKQVVSAGQGCGETTVATPPLLPSLRRNDLILELVTCQLDQQAERSLPVLIPVRYYLSRVAHKPGWTLFVQMGAHRREALLADLASLQLLFCSQTPGGNVCEPGDRIGDWSVVRAIEFKVKFPENPTLERLVSVPNHHRWQFYLKIGGESENNDNT